jgi:hypothetical protein
VHSMVVGRHDMLGLPDVDMNTVSGLPAARSGGHTSLIVIVNEILGQWVLAKIKLTRRQWWRKPWSVGKRRSRTGP